MSLYEDVVNPNEGNFGIFDNHIQLQDKLQKMLSNHNILQHLLSTSFGVNEASDGESSSNADSFLISPATRAKEKHSKDKGWNLRGEILKTLPSKISFECEIITIQGAFHGVLHMFESVDQSYIYFRSYTEQEKTNFKYEHLNHVFRSLEDIQRVGCKEIFLHPEHISEVVAKNFLLRPNAFEIYDGTNNTTYFFNMFSQERRNLIFSSFKQLGINVVEDTRKYFKDMKFEEKWTKCKISSFDYLMLVNKYASRSFNDTSQYPIMPWVGPCGVDELTDLKEKPSPRRPTRRKTDARNKSSGVVSSKERKLMEQGMIRDLTKNSGKYIQIYFAHVL